MDRYCDPWSPVVYETCEVVTLMVLALSDRLLQGTEHEFSIRPAAVADPTIRRENRSTTKAR